MKKQLFSEKLQNELKSELLKVWGADSNMVGYCYKKTSNILELPDGLITFDKPSIKKDFCFSYGQNGVSSLGDEENAWGAEKYARTNKSYFYNENLARYNELIKELTNNDSMELLTIYKAYYGKNDNRLLNYSLIHWADHEQKRNVLGVPYRLGTDEEKRQIIEKLKEERAKFLKRLNTYYKRYGLEKLHTWTYLSD